MKSAVGLFGFSCRCMQRRHSANQPLTHNSGVARLDLGLSVKAFVIEGNYQVGYSMKAINFRRSESELLSLVGLRRGAVSSVTVAKVTFQIGLIPLSIDMTWWTDSMD